jgi:hypothetical protein
MKKKKERKRPHQPVGTVPNSNKKIRKRGKIDTQTLSRPLSLLGTDT